MERTLFSLALAIFLPITQLSAQDISNTDRDAAMKDAIEAQKRAAIEEGRSRDQERPSDGQSSTSRDNNTVTHQYFYKTDSVSQEDWAEIQRTWEELARTGQEAMEAYGEAFNEVYNNAWKEFEKNGVPGKGGFYTPFGMSNDSNFMFYGESERTTWDFSKTIVDDTFSTVAVFDVDAEAKTFIISVSGDCRAGKINIKVIMPDGKVYADLAIDEFGNLNWRKTFNISETENADKIGTWKYQIDATGATGHFKISAQTF